MKKLFCFFNLKKEHLACAPYIKNINGDEITRISYNIGVIPADSLLFNSETEAEYFAKDILKLQNYRITELNDVNYEIVAENIKNYKNYNYKGQTVFANLNITQTQKHVEEYLKSKKELK